MRIGYLRDLANSRHSSGAFSILRAFSFERVRVLLGKDTVSYAETRNGILSFTNSLRCRRMNNIGRERETLVFISTEVRQPNLRSVLASVSVYSVQCNLGSGAWFFD